MRVTQHRGGNTPVAGLAKDVLSVSLWGNSEKVGERTESSLSLATWTMLLQEDRLSWKDQSSHPRLIASTDIDKASNYNRANGELSDPGPLDHCF